MLINLRNAMMAGKRLPYDAEVEYLQSSGNSSSTVKMWINTGVEALANTAMEVTFQYTGTGFGCVMGQGWLSGCRFGVAGIRNNSRLWSLAYNNWYDFSVGADTAIHTFKLDGATKTGSVDSATISFSDTYTSEGGTIGLFCRNCNGGTTQNWGCNGKLYSCKIWQNGTLVRDLIPVRKGAVGYLYDRVTRKLFGNAGTGDFVLGPDVVPVEYIESHGTEWIDTGVTPDETTGMDISYSIGNNSSEYLVAGIRSDDAMARWACNDAPTRIIYQWGSGYNTALNAGRVVGGTVDFKMNFMSSGEYSAVNANGVSESGSLGEFSGGTTLNAFLFAWNNRGSASYNMVGRMYSAKMSVGSNLIRSFRPVRVGNGSTWEGAMMDVLTRRIYRNAGTGAFTYGNDLKYPIPSE